MRLVAAQTLGVAGDDDARLGEGRERRGVLGGDEIEPARQIAQGERAIIIYRLQDRSGPRSKGLV